MKIKINDSKDQCKRIVSVRALEGVYNNIFNETNNFNVENEWDKGFYGDFDKSI